MLSILELKTQVGRLLNCSAFQILLFKSPHTGHTPLPHPNFADTALLKTFSRQQELHFALCKNTFCG